MATYKRELSNLSYTNKDFDQIYPELLDLAKKISYKWDPSLSDESDPGVVLLKLAALMADKLNYNIDKNVLELFPMSVTQLSNARQLYDQCGYTMRYYQSGTTQLTFRMLVEPNITDEDVVELFPYEDNLDANTVKSDREGKYLRHYVIPKYTMFSDVDNSVVYTVTEDVDITSDGDPVSVDAVQGTVVQYSVNGVTTITLDMLDSNRRLYFTELNIPENGIFISRVDSSENWEPVDNLEIVPLQTCCYKFGLALDGRRCYVEFPSDIDTIIGKGLQISYLLTSGYDGNVSKHTIRQFFSEPTITRRIANNPSQKVELTTDNVYIINNAAVQNGKNPETIEEAYKNYQKVKTTFNTLVSTRDYTNFLKTNHDVSNCVVCDRGTDVQSSYSVLSNVDGIYQSRPHVRSREVSSIVTLEDGHTGTLVSSTPEMTAFDLRVYGLKYVDGFSDYREFGRSFDVLTNNGSLAIDDISKHTADIRCLSHNYVSFEPNRIILLKNRYPLVAKIISPYKLTLSQQDEIINNVKLKLFNLLNSQNIEFGEEIDYNLVYDTILQSDPRISAVILDEIKYETYAIYLDGDDKLLKSIRIDSSSIKPQDSKSCKLWEDFRLDVYTRCVLAGKTPLFVPETTFLYSLAQEQVSNLESIHNVSELRPYVNIPLTSSDNVLTTRVLKPNEVVTLTSPNLILDRSYANYVQFITNIGLSEDEERPAYSQSESTVVIQKNVDYVLKEHEYIIFFWRSDDDSPYTYIKYTGRKYNDFPTVIRPQFNVHKQPNPDIIAKLSYSIDDSFFMTLGDTDETTYSDGIQLSLSSTLLYPVKSSSGSEITLHNFISKYIIGNRFNVGTSSIETRVVNKLHLNNLETGTNKFYWILNNKVTDSDGNLVYRLFDSSTSVYTLQDGEQLIYSNSKLTQLYILGTGTKIERTGTDVSNWDCPALDHELEFLTVGPQYFEQAIHPWFNLLVKSPKSDLYATEMQYKKLGSNSQLIVRPLNQLDISKEYFVTSDGIQTVDNQSEIKLELANCSFDIIDESGEKETLFAREHESLKWECRSSLNLNMSEDNPQRLYSNQMISWDSDSAEGTEYTVEGSDVSEVYIQSDRIVQRSGSARVNVESYDVFTEQTIPLKIYVYRVKETDLSTSVYSDISETPWIFTGNEIKVSGKDVSLSHIMLPEGDFLLPIQMSKVTSSVDVKWIPLRKMGVHKLTVEEMKLLESVQYHQSSKYNTSSDWNIARKPVDVSDFARWIYSEMNVDISTEFLGVRTIEDVRNRLFTTDTNDNFDVSVQPDTEDPIQMMLVGYGGSKVNNPQDASSITIEVGDIICQLPEKSQLKKVWACTKLDNQDGNHFICVTSGVGDPVCYGDTLSLSDNLVDSSIWFVLRPSNVTDHEEPNKGQLENRCETVTGVVPSRSTTYYFKLTSDGYHSYRLKITASEHEEETPTFVIMNVRKYHKPTLTSATTDPIPFFDDVVKLIYNLDTEELFDFTYDIPDGELIEYPLNSNSFLDANHPLNSFTICQYTINEVSKKSDLVVVGKSR